MPVRCSSCGVTSELESAFSKSGGRRYCPRCRERREVRSGREALIQFGLIALIGLVMLAVFPGQSPGWIMLNVFLLGIVAVVCVTAHELGHALAGWLMGFRVWALVIGIGPPLFQGRIAGTSVQFNLVPFEGFVMATSPSRRLMRLRQLVLTAGGPLANVALLLSLLFFYAPGELLREEVPKVSRQLAPVAVFLAANAGCVLFSLIPHASTVAGERCQSDGMTLMQLPDWTPEVEKALHAQHYALSGADSLARGDLAEAEQWFEEGLKQYPEDVQLRYRLAAVWVFQGRAHEAREQFARLLEKTEPGSQDLDHLQSRMLLLNDIAWCDLVLGGAEPLEEADRYSAEAFGAMPWVPEFRGTRGALLVELDRPDEGLPLLHDALRDNETSFVKALDACYLAIGEHRRGDAKAARQYLELAQHLDPGCPLLERAVRELA